MAASGVGKTPCQKVFQVPVVKLECEAKAAFDETFEEYENDLFQYLATRNHNVKQRARKGDDAKLSELGERPIEPTRRRATVDDSNTEALSNILKENPKGIVWDKDELAGLMADADKYSSGNGGGQRARLLSSYDCGPWKVDRVGDPKRNLFIPKACVGIFGGIQPAMMGHVFAAGTSGVDEASGFLQRFIFIRAEAEKPGYWSEAVISPASKRLLERIARHLWQWDIEYDAEGQEIEKIVPVARGAKALFIKWHDATAEESFLASNKGLAEKLKAKALRICLTLHCLDAALAGTDGMSLVTEDTMRRALLLADWAKEHQEQCWRFFTPEKGAKQADPIERAIMAVVVEQAARIEADGWKIANSTKENNGLVDLVAAKLDMPGLSSEKIGKAAAGLGLVSCSVNKSFRGRTVTKEKIDSFKATVGTVGPVGRHSSSKGKTADSSTSHLSATVGGNMPEWAVPTVADSTPTVASTSETIAHQGLPTGPTVPTVSQGHIFDFNDTAADFDEVKL